LSRRGIESEAGHYRRGIEKVHGLSQARGMRWHGLQPVIAGFKSQTEVCASNP